MKPSEVLLAARELIAAPNGWATRTYARDGNGKAVHPSDHEASCFCLLGAMYKADPSMTGVSMHNWIGFPDDWPAGEYLSRALGRNLWQAAIGPFNDAPGRTQLEVVVALEKAALLAMEEGQ